MEKWSNINFGAKRILFHVCALKFRLFSKLITLSLDLGHHVQGPESSWSHQRKNSRTVRSSLLMQKKTKAQLKCTSI
jgi:hypothetical protein